MKLYQYNSPRWFFVWDIKPMKITIICGTYKKYVIRMAEHEIGVPWKEIYKQRGRVIRCDVTPVKRGSE